MQASSAIVPKSDFLRPELITFDATGTLIQLENGVGLLYRDILLKHCEYAIRLPRPQFYKEAFVEAYNKWSELQPCFGCGVGVTSEQWWFQVVRDTYHNVEMLELEPGELDMLLPDLFSELYHELFSSKQAWEVKEDVVYVLEKLAAWRDQGNGPKLGVISNFDERLHRVLEDLGILEFFDFVLTSREIGAEKPSRQIFDVAFSRVRCTNPASAYHVGNSVTTDVLGAHAAGCVPVLLNEELDMHVDWGDGAVDRNPRPTPESGIEGDEYKVSDHWKQYLESHDDDVLEGAKGVRCIQIGSIERLLQVFGFPDDPEKLLNVGVFHGLDE